MFSNFHPHSPTDSELAQQALRDEAYRFPSFSASDAVTLGLSIRKRFRSSQRHSKGKGIVINIESAMGHRLFSCTVGDLESGIADCSLDGWTVLEGMVQVVKRTGHSSFYVEKGIRANNGIQTDSLRVHGGAFPIWLENGHCCPIAIVACYSGSSQEDHSLVVTTVRDYINKMKRNSEGPSMPLPSVPMTDTRRESSEWPTDPGPSHYHPEPESVMEHNENEHD
ncbi:hypothetical protein C8J56DRAFT_561708 [Mycena floridula]|nr:hypothetical protein C8J56DRAFT_561708 [Mycena floridula]